MNFRAVECVSISVNPAADKRDPNSERLRADYMVAFRNWALQVDRLRAMPASAVGSSAVNDATERVHAAEVSYRYSRDRLTEKMNRPSE